jgi:2-methylisocitrate lyase-like PEP mutase family enzyme
VLPNVWNPIGARILESEGYPAVATASAAVSAAMGYADGERIRRSTLLDVLSRISRSVAIPVTADIEAGFGASLEELRETIRLVLEAGVVGVNLEDSLVEGGSRRSIAEQSERLQVTRDVADACGVPLVINARIDGFLMEGAPRGEALDDATERARAYSAAGADSIYPIGPCDEDTVRALRDRIDHPINILAGSHALPLDVYREIGIERVSFGPFVFRAQVAQCHNPVRTREMLRFGASVHRSMFPGSRPSGGTLGGISRYSGGRV